MHNEEYIDDIFENGQYPWLFNDDYRFNRKSISKPSNVEFKIIGRVLTCHLFIEHNITKYLELSTPDDFDWGNTKMTFSQKLKLVKKNMLREEFASFMKCIEVINKIRNKFSHNLEAKLEKEDIKIVRNVMFEYLKNSESQPDLGRYTDMALLEFFTNIFCAYAHGLCATIVRYKTVK